MDPITAFAVAKTAINTIKEGVNLAKDVGELGQELDKFFQAKDVIEQEAKKEEKKSAKSKSVNKTDFLNFTEQLFSIDYDCFLGLCEHSLSPKLKGRK